jgi:MerR family transcriptional regulator, copper efflux regulator
VARVPAVVATAEDATGEAHMNIGDAAKASGVSAKMIRYYETIGLLPDVRRSGNGYRVYSMKEVHTLGFIRRARKLGFSVPQIEQLLRLWQDKSRASVEVKSIAERHVAELSGRIEELEAMRRTLEQLACACRGDARPDCPILDDLAGLRPDFEGAA